MDRGAAIDEGWRQVAVVHPGQAGLRRPEPQPGDSSQQRIDFRGGIARYREVRRAEKPGSFALSVALCGLIRVSRLGLGFQPSAFTNHPPSASSVPAKAFVSIRRTGVWAFLRRRPDFRIWPEGCPFDSTPAAALQA